MEHSSFAVTVPANARYLKVVRAFLEPVVKDLFGEGEEVEMLILALDESCSNIVKHRRDALENDLIHVRVEVRPDRIRFRIGDFCGTEDVPKIKPRDLKDLRPGGLGTHFITTIMDRVQFEPEPGQPGRLALVLEKALPGGESPG
ncbi:MAG: ATP-binding protein [Planctomycetes bacterium]|nr:ATP-binding protein [Planctomycetota bacterium]